jgi:hypothetical protein
MIRGTCVLCGESPADPESPEGRCRECWIEQIDELAQQHDDFDAEDEDGRTLRIESFAEVTVKPTRWLLDGRIPLGNATLLVGREKLGKSTLAIELAARLSRGELTGDLGVADSLIVSYEDSASRTIKPRLMAADADLARVHHIYAKRNGAPDLVSLPDDAERIGYLAAYEGARLLIVDPLSAALNGKIDSYRDQDIRRALAPLVALAEEANLALIAVAHWNKAQGGDSLSRVLGSRGLTAAVRSVLAFGVAPDSDEGSLDRVLAHAACNLAPQAPSLSCRVEGRIVHADDGKVIPTSRLVLGDECETRADDLLVVRSEGERTDTELAAEWLADELADGGWHESREVKAKAKAEGYSEKVLRRARETLSVEDRREGFPARSEWRLPVVPSGQGTTDETGQGHDWESPGLEPNPGDEQPSRALTEIRGATGPIGLECEACHRLGDVQDTTEGKLCPTCARRWGSS